MPPLTSPMTERALSHFFVAPRCSKKSTIDFLRIILYKFGLFLEAPCSAISARSARFKNRNRSRVGLTRLEVGVRYLNPGRAPLGVCIDLHVRFFSDLGTLEPAAPARRLAYLFLFKKEFQIYLFPCWDLLLTSQACCIGLSARSSVFRQLKCSSNDARESDKSHIGNTGVDYSLLFLSVSHCNWWAISAELSILDCLMKLAQF